MKERLQNRMESVVRQVYVRLLSGSVPFYVVTEYPKSGGTWIGQMLGEALRVDFPRHRIPSLQPSIMHGHYVHPWGIRNAVCVWRDGRDVMVSWYHHCLFKYGFGNDRLVDIVTKDLAFEDIQDVRGNLPRFIEYTFSSQRHPNFSWADFVRVWFKRPEVVQVKYEDFRMHGTEALEKLVRELTGKELDSSRAAEIVECHSFEKMSGRQTGEESKNSFMRKGIVSDWKNCFSQEAKEVFDHFAGDELVLLGYENARSWVSEG